MIYDIWIKNGLIVNENKQIVGQIFIIGDHIARVVEGEAEASMQAKEIIDAQNCIVMPGVIDDQVHFREPGLTHKGDIHAESKAAIAGGITSYIEQPNTIPNAVTQEILAEKYQLAAEKSFANYSFMMGGTNDNLEEILKTDKENVAGLKLFLGSSTGNMLVDNTEILEKIFSQTPLLIAVHCEDETTIKENLAKAKEVYGDDIPPKAHPEIRSAEACYLSSSKAIALAKKTGARLHVFHISTAMELPLFDANIPLDEKQITAEVCIHHLHFNDKDYAEKGNWIKWNPAVKSADDQNALWEALNNDTIDVIATDHAPHTLDEKAKRYAEAPSGGPMVQHALPVMLKYADEGKITLNKVVEKMCHNPAKIFKIRKRGFLRTDYFADIVIVEKNTPYQVNKENILYKCEWSPLEGETLLHKVKTTIVNGKIAMNNGVINENCYGKRLQFDR